MQMRTSRRRNCCASRLVYQCWERRPVRRASAVCERLRAERGLGPAGRDPLARGNVGVLITNARGKAPADERTCGKNAVVAVLGGDAPQEHPDDHGDDAKSETDVEDDCDGGHFVLPTLAMC